MLRVGLDYRPALLSSAGIGRAVRELARALSALPDLELHLFGHSLARARRADRPPAGARLHRWPIPGRSLAVLGRLGLPASRLCGGARLFHWTDYVHPPAGPVPAVLTVHDLVFAEDPDTHGAAQGRALLARTRRSALDAALVITPSAATRRSVLRHLGCPDGKVRVIPFGADHARADRAAPGTGEPYVVCLGTIEPRKSHRLLLRAWRGLRPPRPRLLVLGAPGWGCAETVAELRAARGDGVSWIPRAGDAEVFARIRGARALVYPSRAEGFGFPPLEAMALGTPVLAGDCEAVREVCGEAALLCPPDPDAWNAALERILGDEELRAELRRRGSARAARFRWADAAAAHARAYREVLG